MTVFTYADYLLLPEEKRYEIIEGELCMTPAPNLRHQRIVTRLTSRLDTFVVAHRLGEVLVAPTDVLLSETNVVQPDLLFVTRERAGVLSNPGAVQGAPDLVIEVLSPATSGRDQVVKRKLYSKFGVREYWIVDPTAQTIEVLRLAETGLETERVFPVGMTVTSPLLPGLRLSVSEIVAQ